MLQGNFAPVDEVGEALQLSVMDGEIPDDFPEGIYFRTGASASHLCDAYYHLPSQIKT